MRGKIARQIRRLTYKGTDPDEVEKVLRHKKTGQIIKDDTRRSYKKMKQLYKTKSHLQGEDVKGKEKARTMIDRRNKKRKKIMERINQKEQRNA